MVISGSSKTNSTVSSFFLIKNVGIMGAPVFKLKNAGPLGRMVGRPKKLTFMPRPWSEKSLSPIIASTLFLFKT